ncbi:MAG: hypothetical protein QM753_14235 [Thermomicrobiales bacterium]
MDYLVFGVGFGSTLVLVGWVLRQFGPTFRSRDTPDDVLTAEQILERNDWQRFCIAMGALLSVCGAVILLVTLVTLLIRPSDKVGTIIVGSLFVIALLAVAGWVVMYVNQHRALAGDRRAEVLATKAPRKNSRPRPAAKDAGTNASEPAKATSPNAAAGSLEDLERRRKAAQQQRRTATTKSPANEGPTAAPRPTPRPAPAATTSARTPVEADDAESAVESQTAPIADPTQALRNVQFKRSGSSRQREDHPAPATTTTTTTTTRPPSRESAIESTDDARDTDTDESEA